MFVRQATMENQFVKQYPELMRGKKIMYVHGFGSSAQSGTVQMLRTLMPNATVVARDIPLHPEEGLQMLKAMAAEEQPDLIIGTSMGGMYTEMLTGFDRILVNPAFEMGDTMSKFTGKQVFQNPREDGVQEFIVTKGLIKEYQEMTTHNFEHAADPDERTRVIALFGDNDPVVHTYDLFHEHYPTAIGFHGEHRLTDNVAMHYLIPVIRYIDDRQEGRERPVVYVDIETLRDSYGNATASMHKAYEMLIEHYNVYVLAPSPSDNAQQMVDDTRWVEQFLSAPAWGRIVFTNQRQMLYGDYLITPAAQPKPTLQEQPEFMGTQIEWGSDEFKTWEEIIVFFDRLGGQ